MTYEEFLNKCSEYPSFAKHDIKDEDEWEWNRKKDTPENPQLRVKWETGGVGGGSCWEDSNPQPYTSNEQPEELTDLDNLLEEIAPNITFLQYRNLAKLIKNSSYTQNEYYGNCTNYAIKKIYIKELYDYLVEKGWLSA